MLICKVFQLVWRNAGPPAALRRGTTFADMCVEDAHRISKEGRRLTRPATTPVSMRSEMMISHRAAVRCGPARACTVDTILAL